MPKQRRNSRSAQETVATASDLEEFIGYNLKRAYVIVHNDFRSALGKDGMALRVFSTLSLVIERPQITQSELARILGIERSGLVAIIDELERRGYVFRTTVPGDRRSQALVPQDAGRDAYREAVDKVRGHEARLLAHLSVDERAALLTLLRKIRQFENRE